MANFTIKQGDTLPTLEATIIAPVGQSPTIPGGSTAVFKMSSVDTGIEVVSAAATITDFTLGKLTYTWAPGNTAAAGDYNAQFVITTPGGQLTVPNNRFLALTVTPTLTP